MGQNRETRSGRETSYKCELRIRLRTGDGVPSAEVLFKESYVSLHPEYTYGGFLSKKASGVMAGISGGRQIAPCPHSFEHYIDYASMPPPCRFVPTHLLTQLGRKPNA